MIRRYTSLKSGNMLIGRMEDETKIVGSDNWVHIRTYIYEYIDRSTGCICKICKQWPGADQAFGQGEGCTNNGTLLPQ